jgi:hypothetical protein
MIGMAFYFSFNHANNSSIDMREVPYSFCKNYFAILAISFISG